ncbi:MAG TPA: SMC family ATPase, partial [Candidatus Binatia bacterium]|nr:SMC family ATPase [Candidatus Binatia bacterium]
MRPCRLRIQGFTSFVEPVDVDFEGLELFAITGPTGAGKTSLLTAMTAALYGRAPEVADDLKQLVSAGGDEARILFEFVAGGRRYRAQRAIHRTRPVQVRLEVQDGAGWKALIRGSRESRGEVERILGLPYETFTKVVLLPQGQVAEFLRGQGRDRRKILTELLGLEIYERVQRAANLGAAAADAEVEARERTLRDEYADATAEHLADVRKQLRQAAEREEQLTQALGRVDNALEAAREEQARARGLGEAKAEEDTARAAGSAAEADLARAQDLLASLAEQNARLDEQIAELAYDSDRYVALRQAEVEARQLVATRERRAGVAGEEGEARQRQDMLAGRLDQQGQALEEARRDLADAEDGATRARRDLDHLEQQVGRRLEVARLRERAARYTSDLDALRSATLAGRAVEDELGALSERV